MPHKARIDAPGALNHIIVRGIELRKIFKELDKYPYCGHSVLMGKNKREWQDKDVLAPGKYAQSVKARSLLCYWETGELGMTTVDLARRLNLAQPTVSQAVVRGQKIAADQGLSFKEKTSQ